jgi:hypothetical protein
MWLSDRQTLAEVVLGDRLRLGGDALDRLERAAHQHEAARDRDRHRDRQADREHDQHLRQGVGGSNTRGTDLDAIARAVSRGGGDRGDEEPAAARTAYGARTVAGGYGGRQWHLRGIEAAVLGSAGGVYQRIVGAGDADEAVVDLGRVEVLDLATHCVLAVATCVRNQCVGDLPRAACLDVEQVRLQVVPQEQESETAEQHEHDGEHAGVPRHQPKAQ